jgi:protein disulfide-isomerase A6
LIFFFSFNKIKKQNKSNIVKLNSKNFDNVVFNSDNNVLVKFYAKWDGHNKKIQPIYEKVAEYYSKMNKNVIICQIDDYKYQEIAKKFDVKRYPEIMFFKKNKKDPLIFDNNVTFEELIKFIEENI